MSASKDFLFAVLGDDQRDAGAITLLHERDCPDCGESGSVFRVRGRDLLYCPDCVKVWRVDGSDLIAWCSECGNDIDERKGLACSICRMIAASGSV